MKMTKYGHSCVRLEKDGQVLVIDPGSFSKVPEALEGAGTVLVTHEHPDHVDQDAVLESMSSNPELELYAPETVAARLGQTAPELSARIHSLASGDQLQLAGFAVRAVGGQHALIHPLIPVVANLGYLIDGSVYHPGDSFIVPPDAQVHTLLVPLHAPWSKTSEVIDFVIAVGPDKAFPIHDALVNDAGRGLVESHLRSIGGSYGTAYESLTTGQSVTV